MRSGARKSLLVEAAVKRLSKATTRVPEFLDPSFPAQNAFSGLAQQRPRPPSQFRAETHLARQIRGSVLAAGNDYLPGLTVAGNK